MRTWEFTLYDGYKILVSAKSYDLACEHLGDRLGFVESVRIAK